MDTAVQTVAAIQGPLGVGLQTWGYVLGFAILGGLARWIVTLKTYQGNGNPADLWIDLLIQIVTSAFAGMLTFIACKYFKLDEVLSALFIGVSGHMGAEAINVMREWYSKFFGTKLAAEAKKYRQDGG